MIGWTAFRADWTNFYASQWSIVRSICDNQYFLLLMYDKMAKRSGSACVNVAFVLLLVQLWFMEAIILVLLLAIFRWVLAWMVIFNLSSSVVVKVCIVLGTSLRVGLHFFLVILLKIIVIWALVVLRFLHMAFSLVLLRASFLLFSLLGLIDSTVFNQQRSLEYFCVNLYHLVLIVCLFLLLLSLELFDFIRDDCSWPVYINIAGLQGLPHKRSKLLFSELSNCLWALLFLNLLLSFLQLSSSKFDQGFEFLRLGNVGVILLILCFFVFWVRELPSAFLSLLVLISSPWFLWAIFKRERLNFDRLFVIFCVFQVEVKVLVNSLEIRDSMWYLWYKSAISNAACRISTFRCSLFWKLVLSLDHPLNSFRQVEISISVDDFFKDFLSSFELVFVDSIKKIDFAIPRHRSCNKLVLLWGKITVDLCGFWPH